MSNKHIPTDAEILALYPYNESEDTIRYECKCGGDYYTVSRDWFTGQAEFMPDKNFLSYRCKACGALRSTFSRIDGNYEKRRRAQAEREELRRELWEPWKPSEILALVKGHTETDQ